MTPRADSPFTREYSALLARIGASVSHHVDLPYADVMDGLAAGKGSVAADYLDLVPAFESAASEHDLEVGVLPSYEAGFDIYGSGLDAGTRFFERHPEAVSHLTAAIADALIETQRDPQIGIAALRARFPDAEPERALRGWDGVAVDLPRRQHAARHVARAQVGKTIDHHARVHGSPAFAPSEVFDPSYAYAPLADAPASSPRGALTSTRRNGYQRIVERLLDAQREPLLGMRSRR